MKISYQNNRIEKLCNSKMEMEEFFSHNSDLVKGLQVLMDLFEQFSNIYEFNAPYFKGYNLEKIQGRKNEYSIRIIPQKRKSDYRMYLTLIDNGIEITIIKIDRHTYKL